MSDRIIPKEKIHNLRLGQIISNAPHGVPQPHGFETWLYYVENDKLEKIIKEFFEKHLGE